MITNIASMTREQCVATMGDITSEMRQLTRSKHRLSVADEAALSALRGDFDELKDHVERLDLKRSFARGGGGATGPSYALEGPDGGVRGLDGTILREPHHRQDDEPADPLSGQRSIAMRGLDQAVKRGLPALAAEVCERLVSVGPDHDRSWTARWIAETGNEHYRSAFGKLLCFGEQGAGLRFTPEERSAFEKVVRLNGERAMSLTDNIGGYLVPFELDPTVQLTSAGSINPLMQISRVVNTVSAVWQGVSSEGVTAEWLAEADEAADGSPTLGEPNIASHKMSCFVPFSVELEGDASSLMMELGTLLQDGSAQLLNTALTTGSGVGQPRGIITALVAAGAPVVVPSAGSDTFALADVYSVQNGLPARFSANAQWCAHLATINTMRQFETTNGAPALAELGQGQLLNRPIHELSNMDGAVNAGQENYTLVYGDWSKFVVTQRVGSTVELIPHLVGANRRPTGQRGVWLWGRYGADAVVPQAFRLLNVT